MPSEFTLTVSLEPYLRQYLYHKYNTANDAILLPKKDGLSNIIRSQLVRFPSAPKFPSPDPNRDTVFALPYFEDADPRTFNYICLTSHRVINNYVKDVIFYVDYFSFMSRTCFKGNNIQTIIDAFVESRGLTYDHLEFETLKKRWYRYRSSAGNPVESLRVI